MISAFTSYTELEGYPIVNSQQKVAVWRLKRFPKLLG